MGLFIQGPQRSAAICCCGGTHSESRHQSSCDTVLKSLSQAKDRRSVPTLVTRATVLYDLPLCLSPVNRMRSPTADWVASFTK